MIDRSLFSLPGIRSVLAVLACCALVTALLIVGQAYSLTMSVVGLWEGGALLDQGIWVASFFFSFILVHAISYAQDSYLDRYAYAQADALRQELLHTVFEAGPELVQESGTGNTTTLVLEGIDQIETYLRLILPKMCRVVIIPLVILVPVFSVDWISGVIMLIVFPFIILYMVMLGSTAQSKAAKQHKKFQIMSNHFIDSLRGLDTLKSFGVSRQHGENIFRVSEGFRSATMETLRVATLSSLVLDLFATLSVAAVAIMLGLRLLDGSLELFPALMTLVLAPEYFKPIREFASDYHASLDGKNALISVRSLIDGFEASPTHLGSKELSWTEDSSLSVDNLAYSYPGIPILRDIRINARGYTRIGIVGASGAGKSTLMKVLAGFAEPETGSFEINGVKLPDMHQAEWQTQTSYLPQDPYIFHGTLRENITFYHPEASDEELASAIRVVGLDDLVAALPSGVTTKIGEGERALSGGQEQRIALARLCLDERRKILLFDEPTAHLDIETEMELKERMLPLMQNRLVFFATHRLHWMHEMDMILVMDQGEIVDAGSLKELCSREGPFMRLVTMMGGATHAKS
ncbi:MAG: thiol reductant ABC exporter subunit CydD [Raoultibacter sp.]|jgi:ATP-binding cassette subfamily C protein CydD